jgi:hypothetical protein
MDWFIKAFIRSSLLWFAAGIVLGLPYPSILPGRLPPRTPHGNVAALTRSLASGTSAPSPFGTP